MIRASNLCFAHTVDPHSSHDPSHTSAQKSLLLSWHACLGSIVIILVSLSSHWVLGVDRYGVVSILGSELFLSAVAIL